MRYFIHKIEIIMSSFVVFSLYKIYFTVFQFDWIKFQMYIHIHANYNYYYYTDSILQ